MNESERLALDRAVWHAARAALYLRELHTGQLEREPATVSLAALAAARHDAACSYHELIAAGARVPLRGGACPEEVLRRDVL